MPWSYEVNPSLRIVEVLYAGKIGPADVKKSTTALIELEHNDGQDRFLLECTDMFLTTSLTDLYGLPNKQYINEDADQMARVAIILPRSPAARLDAQFYETACQNRGWKVKSFEDRQPAIDWLTA